MAEKKTARKQNRLAAEASPYLQQHAENPVDWYPWGPQAFEKAYKEDKPIFLSIGYSTCHWCHVMAHESFENEGIAGILNEYFVSIKVDREERPDVDAVYMEFVQGLTGSGGWPLSAFLTADGKPFYGGTYFPLVDAYGRPGFETVLRAIIEAWQDQRKELIQSADQITQALQRRSDKEDPGEATVQILEKTAGNFKRTYDNQYGGFGAAPKFPQPGVLSFMLLYYVRTQDAESLEMVTATLEKMAGGGMYDHLGGGFHRYSVDAQWKVPHFEKMLYDQALISRAYLQAYQITGRKSFSQTVREIFQYVLRDLANRQGGFYSGEDADSEGQEGTFYIWEYDELKKSLDVEAMKIFSAFYGVEKKGNFEHGENILHAGRSLSEVVKELGIDELKAQKSLRQSRNRLFKFRSKRPRPHRDEKIIAGWNGLMVSSLASGGVALDEPEWITAAQRCGQFIWDNLIVRNRLNRYWKDDNPHKLAVLDDYAFVIGGFLDLYEATFDPVWLVRAKKLMDQMLTLFDDPAGNGFYLTGDDAEKLIVRKKSIFDGAIPAGNSVAVQVLVRMAAYTGHQQYYKKAENVLNSVSSQMTSYGAGLTDLLVGLDWVLGPRTEIVIAGKRDSGSAKEALQQIRGRFLPRTVVLLNDPQGKNGLLGEISEFASGYQSIEGKTAIYICRGFVCQAPVTEIKELKNKLDQLQYVKTSINRKEANP